MDRTRIKHYLIAVAIGLAVYVGAAVATDLIWLHAFRTEMQGQALKNDNDRLRAELAKTVKGRGE